LYIENIFNLNSVFKNPISNFVFQTKNDIIPATIELRKEWNIGDDTIHNIIQLLEDKDIKVIEIEEDTSLFDGLSTIV
jgi:hypothetical protein